LFFAGLSIAVGSASLLNARLVMRIGMRSMARRALITMSTAVLIYGVLASYSDGHPPLWSFMLFLSTILFCTGILFGNLNALAMEPLGKIAGVGAAITSSLATFISVPIGMFIGLSYNGTVLPLIAGFGICSLTAIVTQHLTETRR
jgi:DHA1 family bicyclomycin/chloramphenicol resistance-like MFS transporter